MPTSYTDQFFVMDPYNPPPTGTVLNFVTFTLVDQDDDNDFEAAGGDTVNGSDIVSSWPGDIVTVNVPGVGNITYTGTTFYLANGTQVFTPHDGQVLQNGTLVSASGVTTQGPLTVPNLGPPCFVAGTMIDTPDGPRPIEMLAVGDLVMTLDSGPQPIRWTGCRVVTGAGDFAPIRFAPGALGNDTALLVSPQHRMLIGGWRAELLFGEAEVLVAAKHLLNGDLIHRLPMRSVSYHHILFDGHEIIYGNGIASESFHPGETILDGDATLRAEMEALFPELTQPGAKLDRSTARYVLKRTEAQVLRVF